MTDMAYAQTQGLYFFDIGAPLLKSMCLGKLVQPVNNLDDQPAVRQIGDVFLVNRGVDIDRIFLSKSPCKPILIWNICSKPALPIRLRKCTYSVLWQDGFCRNGIRPQKTW